MPETTEAEFGNMSAIFDKAMPMSADDMEGGTLPSAKEPSSPDKRTPEPARTRETAEFQKEQPRRDTPKPADKATSQETESTLPDFLFDGKKEEPVIATEEGEKEPAREPVPEGLKGKARENFERLDTARVEAEKKALDFSRKLKEAEVKASQGDPTAKTRIEALEKQLSDQSALVARANLEMHPEWIARYTQPRQQLLETARTAIKDSEGDPSILEAALSLKGKARAEKLNELYEGISNKFLLGKIERAVDGIETLDQNKEVVMQNAQVYAKQLQENEAIAQSKQREEYETQTKATLKESTRYLRDDFGLEVLKTTDDPKFAWWNEQASKIEQTAEQIMLKISDPKQLTIAAHLAAACVPYRTMFKQEHELRLKLQKQLSDRDGSEPSLGGERPTLSGSDDDGDDDEKTPLATHVLRSIRAQERKGV